jgi:hypothetical protein
MLCSECERADYTCLQEEVTDACVQYDVVVGAGDFCICGSMCCGLHRNSCCMCQCAPSPGPTWQSGKPIASHLMPLTVQFSSVQLIVTSVSGK